MLKPLGFVVQLLSARGTGGSDAQIAASIEDTERLHGVQRSQSTANRLKAVPRLNSPDALQI
jgi:hypothetical protein